MQKAGRYPTALTIAGSDSGGCAGIQADLKTFSSLGVFGTSVITAVTAQNTIEVRYVEVLSLEIIRKQLEAVSDDITVDAVKTGMLPSVEIIELVASVIDKYNFPVVIADPVMIATSGTRLVSQSVVAAFRNYMYNRITLITPNVSEAEALSGFKINSERDMYEAANILLEQGCNAVLIKGGHLKSHNSTDILFRANKEPVQFSVPRTDSCNLHGTGCTFSSAIAAYIALGHDMENAIRLAKNYISSAINEGKDITTGKGYGPVNHFFKPQPLKIK
ncbi:MAG: bifunctional hydroxymethylpyrimidine kinase/phosphomethylpyrimidine kinase [Bacteroidales bacterium]|jgi:hydroxymethylpyrimidine/phosphomethylpyrimidine kinase|nr:bifunctional hydroxymethylpyrimidine kinase/phosphomethylpyrimidine kinase [Bacteroidales bacterium]